MRQPVHACPMTRGRALAGEARTYYGVTTLESIVTLVLSVLTAIRLDPAHRNLWAPTYLNLWTARNSAALLFEQRFKVGDCHVGCVTGVVVTAAVVHEGEAGADRGGELLDGVAIVRLHDRAHLPGCHGRLHHPVSRGRAPHVITNVTLQRRKDARAKRFAWASWGMPRGMCSSPSRSC